MQFERKLEILADAAKYDASCASSGARKRDSRSTGGIGSAGSFGICHSYAPDGRCISLLKILMTNVCIYDCHFCINRRSSNVERAYMTAGEIVRLTLDFYKRNYIEGLFLSSGIIRSADYTMEQVVRVARDLRTNHHFRGYIHLKTIPEASPELIAQAGKFADRISINIELPKQESLERLAPEKNLGRTQNAMGEIRSRIDEHRNEIKERRQLRKRKTRQHFATGQSTQMLIGADNSNDAEILHRSNLLYTSYQLKRVYFSAFSPIPSASTVLPLKPPPLIREHRLYQADWLMRFYGFKVTELTPKTKGETANLDLEIDPKLAWALRHREQFPVDLNRAPREMLLRIPGIGVRNVLRILQIRKWAQIRLSDLTKLRISLRKCMPFITTMDHHPHISQLESPTLRQLFTPKPAQTEFNFLAQTQATLHGEL